MRHSPPIDRRAFLAALAAATGVAVAGCARAATCALPGPTVGAVTGPFPPRAFRDIANGRPNPGELRALSEDDLDLVRIGDAAIAPRGQIVVVRGQVVTEGCRPVPGAKVELWQADLAGRYNHRNEGGRVGADELDPGFAYWGTGTTDAEGRFTARTIVPGAYPAGDGWWRPPHLHWSLSAQGLRPVTTQSFFDGAVLDQVARIRELNEADHILRIREGFEGRLRGAELAEARRRLRAEMVGAFAAAGDGTPTADLVFRLDA